ncbi:hypothetical protein FJM51_18590 [Amaricoccus solimangrovi]|uniref:Transposase Tn5-like N-terminal domain-containing protein n=1 Tax=Amaricoccus solimangrovi TaxID=2589815 RepID=A0A501WI42_9RHOB|nr:hypothetical protein FJM51_18590 [Amaricoccus solimangrovi]
MAQSWVATETAGCDLGGERLNRRLGAMLEALGERPGKSPPPAFQDWSNTKAAYRFFSNGNVSEDKTLGDHFAASALRMKATDGPILILQDTTEFTFAPLRSSARSIPSVSPLSKRRACAGSTICAYPPSWQARRSAACMSATARATSTSSTAWPRNLGPASWSGAVSTAWRRMAARPSPRS